MIDCQLPRKAARPARLARCNRSAGPSGPSNDRTANPAGERSTSMPDNLGLSTGAKAPRAAAGIAIEAENLSRRFKDVVAVKDVSFHIEEGELFGFLGPN